MIEHSRKRAMTMVVLLGLAWLGCSDDGGAGQTTGPAMTPTQPMQPMQPMQPTQPGMQPSVPTPTGGTMAMPPAGTGAQPPAAGTMAPQPSGGTSGTMEPTAGTGDPPGPGTSILPPVTSTEDDGPFETEVDSSGPHYLWRPVELGKDGLKHPVFVWGTGAGATPDRYNEYFYRFASHGIVVISPNLASKTATDMRAALDWIIEQNDTMGSAYYQKIDPERIGMGGHSQGSVATFDAEGMEDRLKTTIHIAGGSFDAQGSSKVKTPTAYICGETDFALPNCETDFETVADKPTFFAVLTGVDHVACARNAMPGMIAWLRWHLGGEAERAAQFTAPDGDFHQGIWVSQTKNWNF
jgi:hypothetical protein